MAQEMEVSPKDRVWEGRCLSSHSTEPPQVLGVGAEGEAMGFCFSL